MQKMVMPIRFNKLKIVNEEEREREGEREIRRGGEMESGLEGNL